MENTFTCPILTDWGISNIYYIVVNIYIYHLSNSRECMEALQLHSVYKKPYLLMQVM